MINIHISGKYSSDTLDGGWACVINEDGHVREFFGGQARTNRSRMILVGLISALQSIGHLPPGCDVEIETDCEYLHMGLQVKQDRWKSMGWKTRNGAWVPNHDLWKRALKLTARHNCSYLLSLETPHSSLLGRAQYLSRSGLANETPVSAYIDGSFLPGLKAGGWGAVIKDGSSVYEASGAMTAFDNNLMELVAAIKTLEILGRHKDVILFTDSQYVLNGARKLNEWKSSGWRHDISGLKVKNRKWWERLDALMESRQVRIEWVRGHSGIEHNVTADRLAGLAARTGRSAVESPVIK